MLINQLHEKFPNMTDLRVRDILVDKDRRKIRCILSYPDNAQLDATVKSNVYAFVRSCVPKGYYCETRIYNDVFSEVSFRTNLFDYLKKRYPAFKISRDRTIIEQKDRNISVQFNVTATTKNNLEVADFIQELAEHYRNYTCYQVTFDVRVDKDIPLDDVDTFNQEKLVQLAINKELMRPMRCFNVINVEKYIGKLIGNTNPMYISDIRGEMNDCVLCGTVSAKTLNATQKDKSLHMCKFTLGDNSGATITCVLFVRFDITDVQTLKETTGKTDSEVLTISKTKELANDRKMKKLMNIYDGMEVLVRGKIGYNNFSNQNEMVVFDLCLCKIIKDESKLKTVAPVPVNYMIVQPQYYEGYQQASFTQSLIRNEQFAQQKIVVLHVNATGFVATKDKLLCISAYKIINGNVAESIFTYINPETEITPELEKDICTQSGKLVYCHTITELIPDLYKFTHGCTLVGTDMNKILDMLDYYAEPFGCKFTNKTIDQVALLDKMFDESVFAKKPNCAKLEDVVKVCKIPFEKSTFCKNTAQVVAQCLVKLSDSFKD